MFSEQIQSILFQVGKDVSIDQSQSL